MVRTSLSAKARITKKKSMNNMTLLCFCFTSFFFTSLAVDTISANHTIGDGETIVSSGERFELGFFSPGNSTRRYLGIWYNKISKGKVVWVANREIPITDKSGVLKFDERGALILAIQNGSVIWSSNTSRHAQNPVAQLLDSGNLVVRNENDRRTENFVWQSFEHPGNTFLPGMKVGRLASGLDVILSSWKSNDDPSQGPYTFEIDGKGLELVVRQNSVLKSRSGPWNGVGFSGLPLLKPDPFLSYAFVFNDKEAYLTYDINSSIRMASSEIVAHTLEGSPKKKKVGIIVSVVLSALLLLGLGLCLFLQKKRKHNRHNTLGRTKKKENNTEEQWSMKSQDESLDLPHFDLTAIANATTNFSFNNLLGQGGFGPVYKGAFKGGHDIAVKRLSKESRQGLDEFMNEVKCIAKLQHRNLVKLLGYCIEHEEKILIYEYMPNKSLDIYIFDQIRSKLLDWPKRFHIINGVSRGLLYLHQDSRLRIIHRDLKLSNILLDNDMNPKISDFGMARSFGGNETEATTRRVVGTYGYMSPEYAIDGLFSIKSDVFSFGVLVLEIVSGKRNWGFTHPKHELNLLGHVWKLYKEGRSLELIDELKVESCYVPEVLRSIHVGLLCVQHSPEHRPSMSTVVLMLEGNGLLPQPNEPGFFIERKLIEENMKDLSSTNEVTITVLDGR